MSVHVTVTLLHVTVTVLQHTRYMFHEQSFDAQAPPRPASRHFGAAPRSALLLTYFTNLLY